MFTTGFFHHSMFFTTELHRVTQRFHRVMRLRRNLSLLQKYFCVTQPYVELCVTLWNSVVKSTSVTPLRNCGTLW